MPGRKCSVNCCKNSSIANKRDGTIKSYFSFPRDENLRKKWIDACHNTIENILTAKVCSDHFKDEDFFHNKKSDTPEETRKKRLKLDVVPSLNLYVNARSDESSKKTFASKGSNKENPKEPLKRKNMARCNENFKEVFKRKSSVLISDKENAKEPSKKKRSTKKNDPNFLELPRRRSSSGNVNNENSKIQQKKKVIPESNEVSNQFLKNKISKGISNKENRKGLIKRKVNIKSNFEDLRDLPKRKNFKVGYKKTSQKLKKQKNRKIKSNGDLKMMPKRMPKIRKENVKEIIKKQSNSPNDEKDSPKKKINEGTNDKEQLIKQNSSKENYIELSKDLKELTGVKSINKRNSWQVSTRKNSLEKDEHYNDLQNQKVAVVILNNDDVKKLPKRKNSVGNGFPKRLSRKRIRLGRSDSEGSEESSDRYHSFQNENNENGITRDRITYNNRSEMKDNVDLLKYLNYLKEKSRPADQPILFWVDD